MTEPASNLPEFVSIVGASRSGTTLMERTLDSHSQLSIAAENNYMGHLIRREGIRFKLRRLGSLRDDAVVERAVDFLYSGEFRKRSIQNNWGYWRWLKRNVPREDLIEALLRTDRSERAFFETCLAQYRDATGKQVIGEKTPSHFLYVDDLLRWFPGGRVVHMMRDPRAVFASEIGRRQGQIRDGKDIGLFDHLARSPRAMRLALMALVTRSWGQSAARASRALKQHGDRYRVQSFEALVANPEQQLEELVDFLGVPLESAMLDRVVVSRGHSLGASGFDAQAADRWRSKLTPREAQWFERTLGGKMRAWGFEGARR